MQHIRLALIAFLFMVSPAAAQMDARVAAIDQHLQQLEKLGFSGAVLIAEGEKTLLASGYGLADRENNRRWTPTTVSTVGSITKQFTGAAIMALVDDGRVRVDDAITKYFDGVPADKQSITLHQLLTHSSGIVDLEGADDFDPIGRDEFVQRAMAQELAFPPGQDYQYSNAGYSLLGAIIEQVTGRNYEAFVRERFFLPAGMKDTGYLLPAFDPSRLAQGYRGGERWGTVLEHPFAEDGPYWVLRANGGIHSTVEDMYRWGRYLLDGKALSRASMDAYWSPHVDEGGGESFYGYGWVVMDQGGARVITHNGGNRIHFADMAIVPAAGIIVVLQCNVLADFPMVNRLLERIGGHLLAGQPLPLVPDVVARRKSELELYAGTYVLTGGSRIIVEAADGMLDITAGDPAAFTALFSTRAGDPPRARRHDERIGSIVSAWLKGDVEPLFAAYDGRAPREQLRKTAEETMAAWTQEHGALREHRVIGTAFQENDVTLVRIAFERGHIDRLYVWDPDAEEKLLGVSPRGLDAVLHVYPQVDGTFASFEARTGTSRPLRIEAATDGKLQIVLGDADGLRAVRTN